MSDAMSEVTAQRNIAINNIHPRWDVNEVLTSLTSPRFGRSTVRYSTVDASPCYDVNRDGDINMTAAAYHFGETGVE